MHSESDDLYKKSTRKLNAYRAQLHQELQNDSSLGMAGEDREPILSATERNEPDQNMQRDIYPPE